MSARAWLAAIFLSLVALPALAQEPSAAEAGVAAPDAGRAPADEHPAPPPELERELPEGHRPDVTLRIEPREGLVTGDVVHVVITVRVPEGDDVALPRQPFGPFELHAQRHRDRPIEGGRREYELELDLLALEPGEHELPALRLRVVTADGTVGAARTEPQRVVIGSLLANEPDAQPRDPSPPVVVMQDDYTLAWVLGILGGMLLTALITWLIARWWSRRPKKAAPPPPPRPAWESALAKLDALRKKSGSMLENGEHVALADGVSDALREYLGARFDFNGLESTTDEVVARVRNARPAGSLVQEVTALLGDCDLVKFAKAVPSQDECERMIAGAVAIVRATMPAAAPAITPHAAPSRASAGAAGAAPMAAPPMAAPPAAAPPAAAPPAETPPAAAPAVAAAPADAPPARAPDVAPPALAPVDVPVVPPPAFAPPATPEHDAPPPRPIPVTRESPAIPSVSSPPPEPTRGAPITLPLVVSSTDALAPVLSATVLGAVESRALDPDFDGTVIVALSPVLPDEPTSHLALRAVHAELTATLATRRTASGGRVRLVIEHLHESAREAALDGREPRKTRYEQPQGSPTLTGNAFDPEGGAS